MVRKIPSELSEEGSAATCCCRGYVDFWGLNTFVCLLGRSDRLSRGAGCPMPTLEPAVVSLAAAGSFLRGLWCAALPEMPARPVPGQAAVVSSLNE